MGVAAFATRIKFIHSLNSILKTQLQKFLEIKDANKELFFKLKIDLFETEKNISDVISDTELHTLKFNLEVQQGIFENIIKSELRSVLQRYIETIEILEQCFEQIKYSYEKIQERFNEESTEELFIKNESIQQKYLKIENDIEKIILDLRKRLEETENEINAIEKSVQESLSKPLPKFSF